MLRERAAAAGFSPGRAAGCLVLAATVSGQEERVAEAYREAVEASVPLAELEEVARMAHLFGGIPRAVQGIRALGRVLDQAGVKTGEAGEKSDPEPERERAADRAEGRRLFDRIYGRQAAVVLAEIRRVLPGYERWILEHAYGRVLCRPRLPALEREVLAVAALSVLRCPAQLKSHAIGARRLGATRAELLAVPGLLEGWVDPRCLDEARAVLSAALS